MSSGSVAKLHHFVPQAYLRGFANEQERLTAVPLDTARQPFTTSVKNVAAQTHFHTVPDAPEPDGFEKLLSELEGAVVELFRRMDSGEFPLPPEDRMTLSYYIALQAVRGPDTRATMERLQAKMVRVEVGAGGRGNVKSWIRRQWGIDATDDFAQRVWDEATQPGGPPITIATAHHLKYAAETAESLAKYLVTRPWALVRFDRRSLFTCDAPVSLVQHQDDDGQLGVGFATAWGITFPVSRKLGLLMSDPINLIQDLENDDPRIDEIRELVIEGKLDRIERGSTKMEQLFNLHTGWSAREYVYHHPDDAKFLPEKFHAPTLVNTDAGGFFDAEFDGEPWFGGHVQADAETTDSGT